MIDEYLTKDGRQISFKVYEQDPKDSAGMEYGWVLHRIEAYVGGDLVGYLKISYIPKINASIYYPTVWHWKRKHGWAIDPDNLDELWVGAQRYMGAWRTPSSPPSKENVMQTSRNGQSFTPMILRRRWRLSSTIHLWISFALTMICVDKV